MGSVKERLLGIIRCRRGDGGEGLEDIGVPGDVGPDVVGDLSEELVKRKGELALVVEGLVSRLRSGEVARAAPAGHVVVPVERR